MGRPTELVTPERVHGSLFTDELVYEREVQRVWLGSWLFAGHASEVPEPGDYCVKTVGTQPLILSRDHARELHVLYDRCSHFGVRFCNLERGNAATFRCPYHGWTFGNDGSLKGVPYPARYPSPRDLKRTGGLARVEQVRMYRGFLFVYLGMDEAPSFEDYLGSGAAELLDRLADLSPTGELAFRAGWLRHRIRANWKLVAANQVDGYHVRVTHGSLFEDGTGPRSDFDYSRARLVHTRDLGGGHTELDFRPGYRAAGRPFQWFGHVRDGALSHYEQSLREHRGSDVADRVLVDGPPHGLLFPNLFVSELSLYVMEPDGVGGTLASTTPLTIPGQAEFNKRSLRRMEGGMGPAGMLIADDAEVAERTQLGLIARQPEWLDTSRGMGQERQVGSGTLSENMSDETAIRGFWRHYADLMGWSLAEAGPK